MYSLSLTSRQNRSQSTLAELSTACQGQLTLPAQTHELAKPLPNKWASASASNFTII